MDEEVAPDREYSEEEIVSLRFHRDDSTEFATVESPAPGFIKRLWDKLTN